MKKFPAIFLCIIVGINYTFAAGPRYVNGVVSIIQSHEYLQKHPALTYWKISSYYLPQPTDTACSVTAATMVLNAALSGQILYNTQKLVTVTNVLQLVKSKDWDIDVSENGNGVSLDQAGIFIAEAFKDYGFKKVKIEVVHANKTSQFAEKLHHAMLENEKNAKSFIIINFDQSFISGDESVGHFVPIGAYDADKKKVLMMDPDRQWFEPYWIPEKVLIDSMNTLDTDAHKNRGYLLIHPIA